MSSGSSGWGPRAREVKIGHDVEDLVVDAIGAFELEYETDAHHDAVANRQMTLAIDSRDGGVDSWCLTKNDVDRI